MGWEELSRETQQRADLKADRAFSVDLPGDPQPVGVGPSADEGLFADRGIGFCNTTAAGGPALTGDGSAEGLDGKRGGAGSSLVRDVQKRTDTPWTPRQKRAYHRVRSHLTYWLSHDFRVLWVCLTTAEGGDDTQLAYNHRRLRQEIERKKGYREIGHFSVRTAEGYGVLHLFWAWRPRDGERRRSFYIKQDWLSKEWGRIHGAKIVWIARVKNRRGVIARLGRYVVEQYVASQLKFMRMSWSWGRTWGFPLVRVWKWFVRGRFWAGFKGMIKMWELILEGKEVMLCAGKVLSLEIFRRAWREKRKEERNDGIIGKV